MTGTETPIEVSPDVSRRAQHLLHEELFVISQRTDRRFVWLALLEWVAGIVFAISISPRAWNGQHSQINLQVWAAIFLGGLIAVLPIIQQLLHSGEPLTRHLIAASQMLTAGLLVHLTGGRIETHFIFFGLLAFLAFYRDWKVLLTATLVTGLDHLIRGIYWPLSIYGILSASPWRTAEHVAWVGFEVTFLIDFVRQSRQEMAGVALRHAQLEGVNDHIAAEVEIRTRALTIEIAERTHAERRLHLENEISSLLNGRESLPAVRSAILSAIGQQMGWQWVAIWEKDLRHNEMRMSDCWKKDANRLRGFETVCRASKARLPSSSPEFARTPVQPRVDLVFEKDFALARDSAAAKAGLEGFFSFPVLQGTEVVAVVEALNHDPIQSDPDLLDFFTSIGCSIGSFYSYKQSEHALLESERRYRLIFDCNPEPMWIYDLESLRFLAVNKSAVAKYGYSIGEFLALKTSEICSPPEASTEQAQTAATPPVTEFQILKHRVKDGGLIEVEVISHELEWETHRAALVMAHDITERTRAQSERTLMEIQLRQAQKLESIGHLAAGIAHEINTPIQYIGDNAGFLHGAFQDFAVVLQHHHCLMTLAQQQPVPREEVMKLVAEIGETDTDYLLSEIPVAIQQSIEGVERVSTLVAAMKEFSHPGKKEKTAVDLNKAIDSTITVARNEWKYVADMITDYDKSLPPVSCMPGEFNQVVLNIVVNAAHAISEATGNGGQGKGTITVSTRNFADFVEVKIADTGNGIPEKIRGHIFDPFFTTKDIGQGTGQGLAIARSVVVEKHGGTIDFETSIGKGTTFTIHLPRDGKTLQSKL